MLIAWQVRACHLSLVEDCSHRLWNALGKLRGTQSFLPFPDNLCAQVVDYFMRTKSGGTDGYGSQMLMIPELKLGIIVLANLAGHATSPSQASDVLEVY